MVQVSVERTPSGTEFDTAWGDATEQFSSPADTSMALYEFSARLTDVVVGGMKLGLGNVALTAMLDRVVNNLPAEDISPNDAIDQLKEALK